MQPLREGLAGAMESLLRDQPLSPAKVRVAWRAAVGPAMDRATSVVHSESGLFIVTASDDHWRLEVERSRASILGRLGRLLGAAHARELIVRVAPRAAAAPRPARASSRGDGPADLLSVRSTGDA
jgi:hypothetical protein